MNLADGRRIHASATCGEGVAQEELYCKLVGGQAEKSDRGDVSLIQGQICDRCNPRIPGKAHPAESAIDGTERWWQSPPLSRGKKYNQVNVTIDLGQLYHVAYVVVKMANSPRPGVWVLERSRDNGKTYSPWQYFADTVSDCVNYFGINSTLPMTRDDQVTCTTKFSKIVPFEGGEILLSLLKDRPSKDNFFTSIELQEFLQATNIRFRFLRTNTLHGHYMSVTTEDPTVTRRYFYSIKDISIGGRCVCNGHADICHQTDPDDHYKLLCQCQHHTCGSKCERCCDNYVQKKWEQASFTKDFFCEPCNCFNHSEECIYDPKVDEESLSVDIHGNYEGGGVCQNCRDHTAGINCNKCEDGYFRPFGKQQHDRDACQPCQCDLFFSTGNCKDGYGKCECKKEFLEPDCIACSVGYYGFPNCTLCDCHPNGTRGQKCEVGGGQCPCKPKYQGQNCDMCAEGFYGFPDCSACACNLVGSFGTECNITTGECECRPNFADRTCGTCADGYYGYPECEFCNCDATGTEDGVCNKTSGECICKEGYGGESCQMCADEYTGYPDCQPCNCDETGSVSLVCDRTAKCPCREQFGGTHCDRCSPGYYNYPDCFACDCHSVGGRGVSCDDNGHCTCKANFDGSKCEKCKEGFYDHPQCEECNCNPAGLVDAFAGCGSVPVGELCQCKERVTGRICDECKPLYWNLQADDPLGCEDCGCHPAGVMGGLKTCNSEDGQCHCKPSVTSRKCDKCVDGFYGLQEHSIFGCSDCDCDVGGSVVQSNADFAIACNKTTGQCPCRPRLTGRKCDRPLKTYFVPTLHHIKFEAEDGYTPANTAVRFGYDDGIFPGYSWKGYAVFSQIQPEIRHNVYIDHASVYWLVLRYVNPEAETVIANITLVPENPNDITQSFIARFEATKEPRFMTLSEPNDDRSPLLLHPGFWVMSVRTEERFSRQLFLDYFVLIPAEYYEALILQKRVVRPCEVNDDDLCQRFMYPDITLYDTANGAEGYTAQDDERTKTQSYVDEEVLAQLGTGKMALLTEDQSDFQLDLKLDQPGNYTMVIIYHTPKGGSLREMMLSASTENKKHKGKALLYDCPYRHTCRQVVADEDGQVKIFHFDKNFASLKIKVDQDEDLFLTLDSIVAVPVKHWHSDLIQPSPLCSSLKGECIPSSYRYRPDTNRIEVETDNEEMLAQLLPPHVPSEDIRLVFMDEQNPMMDVKGEVDVSDSYVIMVHYYQPYHTEFDLDVLIHNGNMYAGKLHIKHCPSIAGCRSVVTLEDSEKFQIIKNFIVSIKAHKHKSLWLDYIMVIPEQTFSKDLLMELPLDQTAEFFQKCRGNHFYIDPSDEGLCKKAAFTLTTDYNNGAIACHCNFHGSLSFECAPFGGQCPCKPNVIGRRCEICKTGYFGFPDCKPCDCPSTALCDTFSGECICPPRVTGEKCDQCVPLTYGFDPIIGCEECNCDSNGVLHRDLQCDLQSGLCQCKENIEDRTCNRCKAGYWVFPFCQLCNCHLPGTTEEICDKDFGHCYCKKNVVGRTCDICTAGTFYLEESNREGCTECFCFGKTERCIMSKLYWDTVKSMEGWSLMSFGGEVDVEIPLTAYIDVIVASYKDTNITDEQLYFSAPKEYLGNRLTSYGGRLNYTILYSQAEEDGEDVVIPDVILRGNGQTLVYNSIEVPTSNTPLSLSVPLTHTQFYTLNTHSPSSREKFMQVLHQLEGIYIRANYYYPGSEVRIWDVSLDAAVEYYIDGSSFANSVEKCTCPRNYEGTSCEECADGYYRAKAGPYGGFCIPCQCNGHADRCDKVTGKCLECRDNTQGDHCESCIEGYHGNATITSRVDCLICACPIPATSNNFATSCVVAEHGGVERCDCKPGYAGVLCEYCAPGFYGEPNIMGETCKPCECNDNIDPNDPASCDTITGECLVCLNHTGGPACNLCAPGYYGDAVVLKNCEGCSCDYCGTQECDPHTGLCSCREGVIGEKCDTCEADQWGFDSCEGCTACNCGIASESSQCDFDTGQCRCKPGADGTHCEFCDSGYWDYGPEGCKSCNCNKEFASGVGCHNMTGQCECLPGVHGEKCESCPYRWALIDGVGCHECDSCTHHLLNTTDNLKDTLSNILAEFQSSAIAHFTTQKLYHYYNESEALQKDVELLDPDEDQLEGPKNDVDTLENDATELAANSNQTANKVEENENTAEETAKRSKKVKKEAAKAVDVADDTVQHVVALATGLEYGAGPRRENATQEAKDNLDQIKVKNFSQPRDAAAEEEYQSENLLKNVTDFSANVQEGKSELQTAEDMIDELTEKLMELTNISKKAIKDAEEAFRITARNKESNAHAMKDDIVHKTEMTQDKTDDGADYNQKSNALLNTSSNIFELMNHGDQDMNLKIGTENLFAEFMQSNGETQAVAPLVQQALMHPQILLMEALRLDSLLSDTRHTAENAVDAANAYRNIKKAIKEAYNASAEADKAAENALGKCEGIGERANVSRHNADTSLQDARNTMGKVRLDLNPLLDDANNTVTGIDEDNKENKKQLDELDGTLEDFNFPDLAVHAERSVEASTKANEQAEAALERIKNIEAKLPDDKSKSERVQQDVEDAKTAIKFGGSQVEKAIPVVPKVNNLMKEVWGKQEALRILGVDVREKIARLREKVNQARDAASRIEVGISCHPNTTLQLRNPAQISRAATSTEVSLFFKTNDQQGMLLYLGNPPDTHRALVRTNTDDFLSLEVIEGYVTLKMDLGSGVATITNGRYVANGKWYQVLIERIGKIAKLTVRTEGEERNIIEESVEGTTPGSKSVLNLDQKESKLFICGVPSTTTLQDDLASVSFNGAIEELVINSDNIGVWNFQDADNNMDGVGERETLAKDEPVSYTGLRFYGGGFVVMETKELTFGIIFSLKLRFKTRSPDGLIFLVGRNKQFLSVELRKGEIQFQYDLGSGPALITSGGRQFHNGEWHTLEVTRQNRNGLLKVNEQELDYGLSPGSRKRLRVSDYMYFGGYPGEQKYAGVTNIPFDGCLGEVQITDNQVDLSKHTQAYGVKPGCPPKISTRVSFSKDSPGYLAVTDMSLNGSIQLTFKFRTKEPDGMLFFVRGRERMFSVSLAEGTIITRVSPRGVGVMSRLGLSYNDEEWHYVTAILNDRELMMDIDDFESYSEPIDIEPFMSFDAPYFGGVPEAYDIPAGASASDIPFAGCIADVTVNEQLVNFASSLDNKDANLDTCQYDIEPQVDPSPPAPTFDPSMLIPEGGSETEEPSTTTERVTTTRKPASTAPPPVCALPLDPAEDEDINDRSGLRYGNGKESRMEFSSLPESTRKKYQFRLRLKTTKPSGIIFYSGDTKDVDFIALYMLNGKIIHAFNCGSGQAFIESSRRYDDGQWHNVRFTRREREGSLHIDDELVGEGTSAGTTRSINALRPYYFGAIPAEKAQRSKKNLQNLKTGFIGCMGNLFMYNTPIIEPNHALSLQTEDIVPCSDKVEDGVFISSSGGHLIHKQEYRVGPDETIQLEIKPRSLDGLIMAVYGKQDMMVLELVNGSVRFGVDNGLGIMETSSLQGFSLCDGSWHSIDAQKTKNLVTITIDKIQYPIGQGLPGVSVTDTNSPLYIGGLPDYQDLRGTNSKSGFVGCMRNLILDNVEIDLGAMEYHGDVTTRTCPTI